MKWYDIWYDKWNEMIWYDGPKELMASHNELKIEFGRLAGCTESLSQPAGNSLKDIWYDIMIGPDRMPWMK